MYHCGKVFCPKIFKFLIPVNRLQLQVVRSRQSCFRSTNENLVQLLPFCFATLEVHECHRCTFEGSKNVYG